MDPSLISAAETILINSTSGANVSFPWFSEHRKIDVVIWGIKNSDYRWSSCLTIPRDPNLPIITYGKQSPACKTLVQRLNIDDLKNRQDLEAGNITLVLMDVSTQDSRQYYMFVRLENETELEPPQMFNVTVFPESAINPSPSNKDTPGLVSVNILVVPNINKATPAKPQNGSDLMRSFILAIIMGLVMVLFALCCQ